MPEQVSEPVAGGGLPASFTPTSFRGVTRVNDATARVGVSVDAEPGETIRFSLDVACAQALVEALTYFLDGYRERRSQSATSRGRPSVEGSTPDDGQSV